MRKILIFCGAVLSLSLGVAAPSIAGPCSQQTEAPGIFVPDRGCAEFGFGYQYQSYHNLLGRKFHTNGYNVDVGVHLFDWLTGASGRLTVSAEGNAAFGFGGRTTGVPTLKAKTMFLGAGPHIAIENTSRFEPWVHVLVGLERFRFSQNPPFGSNSDLGYMAGGGLDVRLNRAVYWRFQGDYLGTRFQSREQSHYSVGSGILFYF